MTTRKITLTASRIERLKPRSREYTVWDRRCNGLGVRVYPSGHKSFVVMQTNEAGTLKRRTLGHAQKWSVEVAREKASGLLGAGGDATADTVQINTSPVPTFEGFVGHTFWHWAEQCWKPGTRMSARSYLKTQLLPTFGALSLASITRQAVSRWFDRYSVDFPGGANRALAVLSAIFKQTQEMGYTTHNPSVGIRKNPTRRINRFLNGEELQRLEAALVWLGRGGTRQRQSAEIVRLLLLTGCRHREITSLRWVDIGREVIRLADSKTGRREVFLGTAARQILRRLPRGKSAWVFPNVRGTGCQGDVKAFWCSVQARAGLEDVRIHDLRHTFASHAALQGYSLPVIARLLGHKRVDSALRYTHVADEAAVEGARRIGEQLDRLMMKD